MPTFKLPALSFRQKEAIFERWEHGVHWVTLSLVALALLIEPFGSRLLQLIFPNRPPVDVEATINGWLHTIHLVALTTAVVHVALFLLLRRNIGRQLARVLASTDPPATNKAATEDLRSYNVRPIAATDMVAVSAGSPRFETLVELNADIFARSAFEMSKNDVRVRNAALVTKNDATFVLVQNPSRASTADEFIGFTCVLPLNGIGEDCYLNGIIRDRDIRASLISAHGEASEALLVFAVGLSRKYRGFLKQYFPFILSCAVSHVGEIAKKCPSTTGRPTVWVQSEDRKLRRHFLRRGFKEVEGKKSADGFGLYSREWP